MSGAFHPSPRCWPRRSLYIAPQSCPSLVGCLPFPHAIGSQRDTGLAAARSSNMSAPQSDAAPHY
uniref:NARG2_C domain-containing protein n=1 Tax=Mesocestoides corti TaxID=53468 RepID=A0A5K3FKB8_MESCO